MLSTTVSATSRSGCAGCRRTAGGGGTGRLKPRSPSPDVIIHRRGADGPNLLVIEIKKTSNPAGLDCDRLRIAAFREQLHYSFGALVECETDFPNEPAIRITEWIGG